MLRLLRWLIGFVEFGFSGGFCEGFINSCLEKRLNISDVEFTENGITASCPAVLYQSLRPIAKSNGGRLKVVKKRGLIFLLRPLKNRWGLFVGAVAAIVIICVLSGFVWKVEITGNEKIPESELVSLLEENGLKRGVMKRGVEKGRLESLVCAAFPDCAWAHINEKGTTLRLEISEGVISPKTVDIKEYSNLRAVKDGVIVKATVYDGWAVKKKGDAVSEGDILVSGVYESEKKKLNLFAHAQGEYIAEVKEPIKLKISRMQSEKVFIGENKYKYLNFFSLKIPLFLSPVAEGDESEESRFVSLNGESLPLGITEKTVKPFTVKKRLLSDSELQTLAASELENKLKNEFAECEIIKRKLDTALSDDCLTVSGYIICLENIGEEIKIIP